MYIILKCHEDYFMTNAGKKLILQGSRVRLELTANGGLFDHESRETENRVHDG